jgi:hypothetical protein
MDQYNFFATDFSRSDLIPKKPAVMLPADRRHHIAATSGLKPKTFRESRNSETRHSGHPNT